MNICQLEPGYRQEGDVLIVEESVHSVKRGMFAGTGGIRLVLVQADSVVFEMGAFEDCQSLCEVVVTGSHCEIRADAFKGCENLEKFRAHGIQKIGYSAFMDCVNLSDVYGLDSTEFVGAMAFYRCKKMRNVDLPVCKTVEEGAFLGCELMRTVKVSGSCNFTISDGAVYASYDVAYVDPGCRIVCGGTDILAPPPEGFMNPPEDCRRLERCTAFGGEG